MARPLRIDVPGVWYHVTARGNERRAIYRRDEDRRRFLELLGDLEERFGLAVHAYVLMDNHYHLLLQAREANLSRGMQWLGVSYTVWFNRRHRRAGHLFQGRFHAVVLEEGAAAEVSRYVHLNPIRIRDLHLDKTQQLRNREGIGDGPSKELVRERLKCLREYRWSSYRAYAGWESPAPWLHRSPVLGLLGGMKVSEPERAKRYREFVEQSIREGLPASPWERLEGSLLLGGAEFVAAMRRRLKGNPTEQTSLRALKVQLEFGEVVAAVERVRGEPWSKWRDRHGDPGRNVVLYVARRRCGMGLRELGEAVGGLDYRSVGSALSILEKRLKKDRTLAKFVENVDDQLQNKEM